MGDQYFLYDRSRKKAPRALSYVCAGETIGLMAGAEVPYRHVNERGREREAHAKGEHHRWKFLRDTAGEGQQGGGRVRREETS